jgi:hypothetical protein
MRVMDRRGIEYDVTYDAERQLYVYRKVFKPSEEASVAHELSLRSAQMQSQAGSSHGGIYDDLCLVVAPSTNPALEGQGRQRSPDDLQAHGCS